MIPESDSHVVCNAGFAHGMKADNPLRGETNIRPLIDLLFFNLDTCVDFFYLVSRSILVLDLSAATRQCGLTS